MVLAIVDIETGDPIVAELCEQSRWEEAFALLDRLEPLTTRPLDVARLKLARVRSLSDLDWARGLRNPAEKHALLDEVQAIVRGESTELEAMAEFQRGMALHLEFIMAVGDADRELECFTRAAALFESIGDLENAALSIAFIGIFHHVDRLDRDAAIPFLQKAYELTEAGRGSEARSEATRHLGQIHQERGEFAAAIPLLEESLAARAEAGSSRHLASALHALGYAHLEAGNLDTAEDYLDRGRHLGELHGSRLFLPMIAKARAELALRRIVGPNTAGRTHP